jgi:hypothetical protein
MKRAITALGLAAALLVGFGLALPQQNPSPKPDKAKILGEWNLEIDAGGMIINLTMVIGEAEGKLSGKVSEQNGMFTDAALSNIEYTGPELSGEISVPSPPDDTVKVWAIKLNVGEDTVEGTIANADTGMSAAIAGKRVKKA